MQAINVYDYIVTYLCDSDSLCYRNDIVST